MPKRYRSKGLSPVYVYAATAVVSSALTALLMAAGLQLYRRLWPEHGPDPSARLGRCGGEFDLLIRNGQVLDGLGREAVRADVGVRGGRVACVGVAEGAAAPRVIDAAGMVVAPGFIDVHTHVEKNMPAGRAPFLAPNFVRQGVTTLITGNCGRSALPLAPMLGRLEQVGTQVNVASLVGHNSVRGRVMGRAARAPSEAELAEMRREVGRAMSEGALGLSTGLTYLPGAYARREELVTLARAAGAGGGMYVTHLRDEGAGGAAAIEEALQIGSEATVPVHISHFKAQGRSQWGQARARLALIDDARRKGVRVSLDQYPYTASSTSLGVLLPSGETDDGSAQLKQELHDPQARARLRKAMLERLRESGWNDYSFARVAYCPSNLKLNGLNIAQIAGSRAARQPAAAPTRLSLLPGGGDANAAGAQADVILDLLASGGAQMIYFDMSEDDVAAIMGHADTMFGSDSGVRLENAPAIPHPRGLGTFPRVLAHYVRDMRLLSLPETVRRMTSLPAQTFGLSQRGQISADYWADIVIFDPAVVRDKSTYEEPLLPPQGISYVLVNGTVILDEGRLTTALPGKPLRGRAAYAVEK